jgi:hypothetical protein
MRWTVAILICLLAACRHQPQAYLLKQQGRTLILAPPPSKPEIKSARKHPIQKTGCDVDSESFAVAWHGNTARVTVRAESYYAPPAEQPKQQGTQAVTIAESGPRVYVDSVAELQKFRDALAAKEDAGCFRGDEGTHLRQAITEAFPFAPGIAVYLRFGAYTQTSFFDLTPEFLLRLVSPPVTKPDISLYAVVRRPGDDRMRITLVSGEGKSLTVPEMPAYFRYFYRTGASAHNFLATILGAPDRKKLHEATDRFLADPEAFCEKPSAGVFCQSVNVGINAGFYVQINGKDGFVRLGGTVGEAIEDTQTGLHEIGRRRTLPENVTVRRMFHGKLIPIKVDGSGSNILSLVAMPGDAIAF